MWSHIEDYNHQQGLLANTPDSCRVEVLRFLGCLPLTRLDFRLDMNGLVTCSDASSSGGGACVSRGLTKYGEVVSHGSLRGELAESQTGLCVLSIGLFDGIAALRVALDLLGVQVLGHVSVEPQAAAHRVVESNFPGTLFVKHVEEVTAEVVEQWRVKYSQCDLVVLGAGPPCQGVSGLNFDRKGVCLF